MNNTAAFASLCATLVLYAPVRAGCPDCVPAHAQGPDWLFAQGDYTHSPMTGERVAQYAKPRQVEGLPDPREITSRYSLNNTILRGANGSVQSIVDVQTYTTSRGGIQAQRERAFGASLEQLRALEPFRNNPWLFYGAAVGPGGAPGGQTADGQPAQGGAIPAGGFPPFGVPTQPYGGVGPYVPPFFGFGFPYGYPYGAPPAPAPAPAGDAAG